MNMESGLEEVKKPTPRGEWAKARVGAEFHLDPRKQDRQERVDPLAEAQHRAILDQISSATAEELAIIQKNKSEALDGDDAWMEDEKTVEIVNAVYRRSQELFAPKH